MRSSADSQKQSLIVVADSNRANRQLLCTALRNSGHEPIEATNAAELSSHLSVLEVAGLPIAAVIADVLMPGLEQCTIHVPLIAMVSLAGTAEQADALCPAAVIHRPIFVDEVQQAVKHLTSKAAKRGTWRDHHRRRMAPISIHHTLDNPHLDQAVLCTWS